MVKTCNPEQTSNKGPGACLPGASPLQRRKEKADYRSICGANSVQNAILNCGASQPRADLTSTVSLGRCADDALFRCDCANGGNRSKTERSV